MAKQLKRGTTGVSYGLVVGLIAVVALTATTNIGGSVDGLFTDVGGTLNNVTTGANDALPQPSASASSSAEVPLFAFTSFTFTSCNANNSRNGPTLVDCKGVYNEGWDENAAYYDMPSQGVQLWTVPSTAAYRIEAAGASNESATYKGARLRADVDLNQGDKLMIVVGQEGYHQYDGAGGSFVVLGTNPSSGAALVIAGGAAGHYNVSSSNGDATLLEDYTATDATTPSNYTGPTGSAGSGGGGYHGGGGGGFSSNGSCNNCNNWSPGESWGYGFQQGARGGEYKYGGNFFEGGFGGGGAYHSAGNGEGGGGGYSGGRGGYSSATKGFGGGSYTGSTTTNRVDIGVTHTGAGYVTITKL